MLTVAMFTDYLFKHVCAKTQLFKLYCNHSSSQYYFSHDIFLSYCCFLWLIPRANLCRCSQVGSLFAVALL